MQTGKEKETGKEGMECSEQVRKESCGVYFLFPSKDIEDIQVYVTRNFESIIFDVTDGIVM